MSFWRGLTRRGADPVVVVDRVGVCVFASDAATDMMGLPRHQLVGSLVQDLLTEPHGGSIADRIDRARDLEMPFTASLTTGRDSAPVRVTIRRPGGTHPWVTLVLARAPDAGDASVSLARRLELEHLIDLVQVRFMNSAPADITDKISWALEYIGRFLGADRGYVLEFNHGAQTETMTHEWVAEGQKPELGVYLDVPWDAAPAASRRNTASGISAVPDVSKLTGEWSADREFFESSGIQSILELPVIIDGHPVGSLGFDWLTSLASWTEDDLTLLKILAASFAQLLGREVAERELRHRADHDALTGLLNRHGMLGQIADHLCGAGSGARVIDSIAVVCIDIDGFKLINDSLGPFVGDLLLIEVAQRLRSVVRSDDLIARLGGDEFCVLMPLGPGLAADRLVERLRLAMSDPYSIDSRSYLLTVSCGIAASDGGSVSALPGAPDEAAAELLRRAGAAVLRAKELGRSRQESFDDSWEEEITRRLELDQELRGALGRGEFEVHYQPEHELVSGKVVGAEALLRWRSQGQLIPAAAFIDVVERTGLIVDVGAWVLSEACAQAARWRKEFGQSDLMMRVNLSVRQLEQPDLVQRVADALQRSGLPADSLCLEITETSLMTNPEGALRALERLDELGVELAIDDFGTGYSSLAYLKKFPFDVLKIDRAFVIGLPNDREDTAIVRSVIALADALGMIVTAEGIETSDQAVALAALSCTRGQGYWFSRPMPAGELESTYFQPSDVAVN